MTSNQNCGLLEKTVAACLKEKKKKIKPIFFGLLKYMNLLDISFAAAVECLVHVINRV